MFGEGPSLGEERVALATEELRRQVISYGGRVAPIPNVSHAELVRRSLERRRPFDGNDRGYRDSLLWHTTLEFLREGHSVVLVSHDKSAFAAPKTDEQLHPALEAELRAYGCAGELRLVGNLDRARTVVEEMTSPEQKYIAELLASDQIAAEVMHGLCIDAHEGVLEGEELRHWGWSDDLAGIRVLEIKDFGGLRSHEVVSADDGKLKAKVQMEVTAELDVRSFDLGELGELEALATPGPVHDIGVGLTDGLVQAYVDRRLTLTGEIQVSRQKGVDSAHLTAIELPRYVVDQGQLALGFPFNDFADY